MFETIAGSRLTALLSTDAEMLYMLGTADRDNGTRGSVPLQARVAEERYEVPN